MKNKLYKLSVFIVIFILNNHSALSQSLNSEYWLTKFERSNFTETARYIETMDYFKKFEKKSAYAKMVTFGKSPEGRDINCLIASKDRAFTPQAARQTNKPVILIINGIHSGEIEGKDASMLLLRDILITKEKLKLIDNVTLLVVPIFSVDAHERFGKYNRINQNGPVEMGWRTTSQNLNLNRDWMKADAPEMQAMLSLFSKWMPDFFVDTHTTDGADYQYTITYGMEKYRNIFSATRSWIKNKFIPFMENKVIEAGYLIAPYLSFKDGDIEKGIVGWAATPRFSQGYAAVQNRPGLLVETHMLKPYKDRVFSTKSVLNAVIEYVSLHPQELIELNKRADINSVKRYSLEESYLPVSFKASENHTYFNYKGIKFIKEKSWISGTEKKVYTGEKIDINLPYYNNIEVIDSVVVPKAYLIPVQWKSIVDRIKLHGIKVEQLKSNRKLKVKRYKFYNVNFAKAPYEGRQHVDCNYTEYEDTVNVPKGTYVVNTNQRTVRVIVNLLEPKGDDSFLRWGFFNSIFERKEYFENYVMEKYALQMVNENPKLKEEFQNKLAADENFKNNPNARLNFFYERSPYYDEEYRVYPIMMLDHEYITQP